jgi:carbonic anhydrase
MMNLAFRAVVLVVVVGHELCGAICGSCADSIW